MGVIRFQEEPKRSWVVAGWAYRQILEDVITNLPGDSEVVSTLATYAEADGVIIDLLQPDLGSRISRAIQQVTEDILAGRLRSGIHDKPFGNPHMIEEYRKGLQQLLEAIPASLH
jgi:hypothetical protein